MAGRQLRRGATWAMTVGTLASCAPAAESGDNVSRDQVTPSGATLVDQMQTAHGGVDRWQRTPALYFERDHFVGAAGSETRLLTHEFINLRNGDIRQEWPEFSDVLTWNGTEVGTHEWKGAYPLPPGFLVKTGPYFAGLPFRVSSETHEFEFLGTRSGDVYGRESTSHDAVRAVHRVSGSEVTLFLDPATHILQALEFYISDPDLLDMLGLPPEADRMGPNLWRIDSHVLVDGLLLPGQYAAFDETGRLRNRGEYRSHDLERSFVSVNNPLAG